MLFRELLPQLGAQRGERVVKDLDVFENSLYCWAHIISKAKVQSQCDFWILKFFYFIFWGIPSFLLIYTRPHLFFECGLPRRGVFGSTTRPFLSFFISSYTDSLNPQVLCKWFIYIYSIYIYSKLKVDKHKCQKSNYPILNNLCNQDPMSNS